jgi:D-3-phosphoglycerate dehydrogenase
MGGWTVYVALQQFCECDDRPRQLLQEAGCDVRQNPFGRRLRAEDLREVLQGVDAVLAGVEPYDAGLLRALPRLKCISRCGIGTDAIEVEEARRLGITVCATADEVIEPVAQLTVAMILALARNFPWHIADARAGRWQKRSSVLLSEWTVGLVGFGRIGRVVAEYLHVFQPRRICVTDPVCRVGETSRGVALRDLSGLLAESDVVSIHASRRQEEGPLIGPAELAQMKPGGFLVNTSRGSLVDERALYEALTSGRLAGAALDVFEEEPYQGPLMTLPQVLCTPHVATLTKASRAAMELRCAQHVVDCLAALPAGSRVSDT